MTQPPPPGPGEPPLRPPAPLEGPPVAYDPAQSYLVYQAAPTAGYGVPIFGQQSGYDPLISPNYGGWWQRSLAVIRTAWRPLAVLQSVGLVASLLVTVPQALYLVTLLRSLPQAGQPAPAGSIDLSPLFAVLGISFLGAFLVYLVRFAISIASNHVGVAVAAGLRPQLGPALATAVKRLFPLLGWQLLAGLLVAVGLCACVLPGIYLAAVFVVLPAVVTFERGAAISRCFAIFHRDFGAAVGRIATILGLAVGVAILAAILGQVVDVLTGGTRSVTGGLATESPQFTTALIVSVVVSALLGGVLDAVAALFTAILTLTAYADLRARMETLSTAVLASELGIVGEASPAWGVSPPA